GLVADGLEGCVSLSDWAVHQSAHSGIEATGETRRKGCYRRVFSAREPNCRTLQAENPREGIGRGSEFDRPRKKRWTSHPSRKAFSWQSWMATLPAKGSRSSSCTTVRDEGLSTKAVTRFGSTPIEVISCN